MFIFKYLLWPFAVLYDLVTRIRNYLYDIGHKKSFEFETIVISVGNLNVGGSGKTPMIEYLIRLLADRLKVATLSRGYGRKTQGIRLATAEDTARTIGDEPCQLMRKFGDRIYVAVGEERALAIPTILNTHPEVDIILLDDAFQHRSVKPQCSIMVTDFEKPFYTDHLLPMGRLREARKGASRADIIVVTKADGIDEAGMDQIKDKIQKIAPAKPVFFTGLSYQQPVSIGRSVEIGRKVLIVSAIAKNIQLRREVSKLYEVVKHIHFEDHHIYTSEDIQNIHQWAIQLQADSILTTEKDMVKLISLKLRPLIESFPWFYLPVQSVFLKDGTKFDELILQSIENNLKVGDKKSTVIH